MEQNTITAKTEYAPRGIAATPDQVPYASAVDMLNTRIEVLDSRVERIVMRIDKVLLPSNPSSDRPSQEPFMQASDATEYLRGVERRLDEICQRLDTATDRIDL